MFLRVRVWVCICMFSKTDIAAQNERRAEWSGAEEGNEKKFT